MSNQDLCAPGHEKSGKDLGDPDVSGWGVVAAFSTSAFLAVGAIILAYIFRALPPGLYNQVDFMVLEIIESSYPFRFLRAVFGHIRSRDHKNETKDEKPPSFLNRRSSAFTSFLLAMSDQHLVTGMAILLTATLVLSGTLGELYESMTVAAYSVAVSLAFLSYLIHLCTITTLRSYFDDNPRLRNVRVILMTIFLAMLIPNTIYAQSASFWNNLEFPVACAKPGFSLSDPYEYENGDPSEYHLYIVLNQALLQYIIIGGYIRRLYELYFPSSRASSAPWPVRMAYWAVKRRHLAAWKRIMARRRVRGALLVLDGESAAPLSRKSFSAYNIMFWLVTYEISQSFLWEIIWLLFYSTFGFTTFFWVVRGRWEMMSSAPVNFGQLMPILLLLLPALGFLEGWSEGKKAPAQPAAAENPKETPTSDHLTEPKNTIDLVAASGPSPDPEAQGATGLVVPVGPPADNGIADGDPENLVELQPYPTGYGFKTVKSLVDRAKEVLPERSHTQLQQAAGLNIFRYTVNSYPWVVKVYTLVVIMVWFLILQGWALISSGIFEEEIFRKMKTEDDMAYYNFLVSMICFYTPLVLLNIPVLIRLLELCTVLSAVFFGSE